MPEMLTIVGASVRAAAQSAQRAGYATLAADLFADADLVADANRSAGGSVIRIAEYPAGFEQAISGPQPGGWLYTGGIENYPELVDRWARRRPLWGSGATALLGVRDPWRVAAALRAAGLHVPTLARPSQSPEVNRLPSPGADGSLARAPTWLRKTLRSSGGSGIAWASAQVAAEDGVYFQQYISGESTSAVFIAAGREARLLGVTRQLVGETWTGAGGFRYCGSIGPLALAPPVREQFQRIGAALAAEFDLVGLFGVDAVISAGAVWPVEVNPRYTASVELLERASGRSAIGLHLAACRSTLAMPTLAMPTPAKSEPAKSGPVGSEPVESSAGVEQSPMLGKAIVFAGRPLIVLPDVSAAWLERGSKIIADVPHAGERIDVGQPIATVFAIGHSVEDTADALRREVEAVRREAEAEYRETELGPR